MSVQLKIFTTFNNDEEKDEYFRDACQMMDTDSRLQMDGKHESELLEFLYKPSDIHFEMEVLNTDMFFSRPIEYGELANEISHQARSNLIKRQEEMNLECTTGSNLGWNDKLEIGDMVDLNIFT